MPLGNNSGDVAGVQSRGERQSIGGAPLGCSGDGVLAWEAPMWTLVGYRHVHCAIFSITKCERPVLLITTPTLPFRQKLVLLWLIDRPDIKKLTGGPRDPSQESEWVAPHV